MTEKEFLEKRYPFYLEGEDLTIVMPKAASDRNDMHISLCEKYHYRWIYAIRGYYWPGSHVMLYIGDYEIPNCTVLVASYIFSRFPDIKYLGLGCNKGKPGEIWPPKLVFTRDLTYLKGDIFSKQTEDSI